MLSLLPEGILPPSEATVNQDAGKFENLYRTKNADVHSSATKASSSRSHTVAARGTETKEERTKRAAGRTTTAAIMMGESVAEWPLLLRIILSPILLLYFGARVYVLPCIGIALQRCARCCCRGFLKYFCCGCGLTFTDSVSCGVECLRLLSPHLALLDSGGCY